MSHSAVTTTIPIIAVPNVDDALTYYSEKLGFSIVGKMGDPTNYGIVERDGHTIHFLSSRHPTASAAPLGGNVDDGKGGVYIEVSDVDATAEDLMLRGAANDVSPEDKSYGMRDFWIRDLNGYILAFGTRRET